MGLGPTRDTHPKLSLMKHLLYLGLLSAAASLQAIVFDFDSLTAGDLNGQNGWAGADTWQVVAGVGTSGSNAIRSNDGTFKDIFRSLDAADLGAPDDGTGAFNYSVTVTLEDAPNVTQTNGAMYRLYLTNGASGGTTGPAIFLSDAGRINVGGSDIYTLVEDETVVLSGTLDFDTGLFDVSVDGVSAATDLGFTAGSTYGQFGLRFNNSNPADYKVYTFDDISIEVVPEPSVFAAAAGLLALACVWLRRRRAV